jgi:hypothetical protein
MTISKIYINHEASDSNGTHLQGDVTATKRDLKGLLGKPLFESFYADDKVLTEWIIEFKDGMVATLYDWKLDEPLQMDDNYAWHIGGHKKEVVERVRQLIKGEVEYEIEN